MPIDVDEILQTADNSPILAYPRTEKAPVQCSTVDSVRNKKKNGKIQPTKFRITTSKWPIEPGQTKPKQVKIDIDFNKAGDREKLDKEWKFYTYSCEEYDLGTAEPENRRNDPSVQ